MAAGVGGGRAPAPRTFRRSLTARLASLTALLLFGAAVVVRLAAGETGTGLAILAGLAVVSLIGVVGAWGDRVTIDADGVAARNALLSVAGRRLAWNDVVRVQEHRRPGAAATDPPRALFLVPARGRRLALDSLQDFDEACRLVRLHLKRPRET